MQMIWSADNNTNTTLKVGIANNIDSTQIRKRMHIQSIEKCLHTYNTKTI